MDSERPGSDRSSQPATETCRDIMRRLEDAVIALSLPADAQVDLFPSFVVLGDELAGDLDDALALGALGCSTDIAWQSAVERVRSLVEAIDGLERDEAGWTMDAVIGHPSWERVRTIAKEAAVAMGVDGRPPVSWNTYMK